MNSNILKLKLKRVDPVKYATITTVLTLTIMLIFGLPFFLIFSAIGIGAGSESIGAGAAFIGGGIIGMIFGIIVYGVIIFVVTLIATSLLNFVLKKTGGLDIDFEKVGFDFDSQQGDQGRIEQ